MIQSTIYISLTVLLSFIHMDSSKASLNQLLISVTKKYLSVFSHQTKLLDIDRYPYVLVLVDDHQELLTQKDLAEHLQVDKSFIVNIIDHLSAEGYVYRERNEKDRRQQVIKLTDKAKETVPKVREVIDNLNARCLENLTPEQVGAFMEALNQMDENLVDSKPFNVIINFSK